MLLDIVFNLFPKIETASTPNSGISFKDTLTIVIPVTILIATFYINNWWQTKDKNNDELKIFDNKYKYLKSLIHISIQEIKALKHSYENCREELNKEPSELPTKFIMNLSMTKTLITIDNVEYFYNLFNSLKNDGKKPDYNELISILKFRLDYFEAIFIDHFSNLENLLIELNNRNNEIKRQSLKIIQPYLETNPEMKEYYTKKLFIDGKMGGNLNEILNKLYKFPLDNNIWKLNDLDKKKLIENCNSSMSIISENDWRIESTFKGIDFEITSLNDDIENLEILFSHFIENYKKYPKPYYGDNFINKLKHFILKK